MSRRTKWLLASLIVILGLFGGGYGLLKEKTYPASVAAQTAAKSAQVTADYTVFKGNRRQTAVVFYSGALVTPASYSVWAQTLARHGHSVYIMHFPLNLAVLASQKANEVPAHVRRNYVIGGHSLGGVMASRYAKTHRAGLKGVFYLASYPDQKGRLDQTTLPVLSITASRDGVLNWANYRASRRYLPAKTQYASLAGGNHGGFGSYGQQKGDRQATISNQRQQQLISQRLLSWLATK